MFTSPYVKERHQAMHNAIANLDLNRIKKLFNKKPSQKEINEFLLQAIDKDIYISSPNEKNKLLAIIKFLVANGASIIFCCNENNSELEESIAQKIGRMGSNNLVEFLAKKINSERTSSELRNINANLLLGAFENVDNGNAKLILNNIINMKDELTKWRDDKRGDNLLHLLIRQDSDLDPEFDPKKEKEKEKWEIAKILLSKYKLKLYYRNKHRESPLDVASRMEHYYLLNLFWKYIKVLLEKLHQFSSTASSKKDDKRLAEIIYLIDIYKNTLIRSQVCNQQQHMIQPNSSNMKIIDIGNKKYRCKVINMRYEPGWCAFNAVQDVIKNSIAALEQLKKFITTPPLITEQKKSITQIIARALYNNIFQYYHHAAPKNRRQNELFPIKDQRIKTTIDNIYKKIETAKMDSSAHKDATTMLWKYVEDIKVQYSYLDTIIEQKYPDNLIVAACLAMYGKTLYTFRCYRNNNDEVFFCDFDTANANVKDPNAICVVHYPNPNVLLSHYCRLTIGEGLIGGKKRKRPPGDCLFNAIVQQNKKRKL